jgi:predicted dehydrogenase
VIGPKGCVSIVAKTAGAEGASADVDSHSKTESLRLHHAALGADGKFVRKDDLIDVTDEPNHDELCRREQEVFLQAIRNNTDLSAHWQSAVDSLRIVLAADRSFREGRTVEL